MFIALLASVALLQAAKPNSAFQPRVRPYDAISYRLDVRLKGDDVFDNKLTAAIKPRRALSEIELDAYGLQIASASIDGAAATFTLKADPGQQTGLLVLKAAKPLAAGKDATVQITYSVKAGLDPVGIFKVDGAGPEGLPGYFTHFETQGAQHFFPCNDQPDDKATTEIFAVVDGRYQVLSNGRKEKDETFTEGGLNLRRVDWKQDQPHSPYLVALGIGAFEPVLVGGDTPATVWVQPGSANRAFVAQDATRSLLTFEAGYLGVKYPWAKYDQAAVPRFFFGGMENTSMVFMRESAMVLPHKNEIASHPMVAALIAHELAHQWFGDYVTCKWWDDTWLNEGFASYLGSLALDNYLDNDFVEASRAWSLFVEYFRAEDGPRSHPLVGKNGPSPDEVFDAISYTKGAQVLRMLELWVGRAEMKKALKGYLEKNAFGNATSDDFFKAVFASTGQEKELRPFKEAWLKKRGYPVIFPEASFSGSSVTVTIKQQPNQADEKGPFVFKLPIVIHRETEPKYTVEATVLVDKPTVTLKVDVPAAPQWINWNKDSGALVRVNTPSVPEEQWVDACRNDPDPAWRLLAAWTLLGELVNPAMKEETRPTDAALGAVMDLLVKDPSPYVRELTLNRLTRTRWKKLPAEFGPAVLGLARRPVDLPEDAVGLVRVRRAAMITLGKIDFPEGRRYLLDELVKREVDINFLPGFAAGTAHIGSNDSLATLRAAVATQKARGYPYYRIAVEALATAENAEALPLIGDELKANSTNNELVRGIIDGLRNNDVVKASPEYVGHLKDWVLDEKSFALETRTRLLGLFEELKTKEAKEALLAIAEKATADRLKGMAKLQLETNFKAAK